MTNWTLTPEDFESGKPYQMIIREKNVACAVEGLVYGYFQSVCEKEHPEEEAAFMTMWGAAVTSGATFNETETVRREFLTSYYKEEIETMI